MLSHLNNNIKKFLFAILGQRERHLFLILSTTTGKTKFSAEIKFKLKTGTTTQITASEVCFVMIIIISSQFLNETRKYVISNSVLRGPISLVSTPKQYPYIFRWVEARNVRLEAYLNTNQAQLHETMLDHNSKWREGGEILPIKIKNNQK